MTRIITALLTIFLLTLAPAGTCGQKPQGKSAPGTEATSSPSKKSKDSPRKKTTSGKKSTSGKKTTGKKGTTGKKSSAAPARSENAVRKEKKQAEADIRATGRQLQANAEETSRKLSQLDQIGGEIEECNGRIAAITGRIDSIHADMSVLNDSIEAMNRHIEKITASYVTAVKRSQGRRQQMGVMAFIFSSESFAQAWRRARYLRQFARWRERTVSRITSARRQLEEKRARLVNLATEEAKARGVLASEHKELVRKQTETNTLVEELRGQESSLREVLAQQRRKAAALDNELNDIIAREIARREAERREAERREAERQRAAREEAARKAAEEEAARIAAEEAEARRRAEEAKAEADRKAAEAEARRKAALAEAERKEAEARKRQTEEARREAEAARRAAAEKEAEARRIQREQAEAARKAEKEAREAARKAEKERKRKAKAVKHDKKKDQNAPESTPSAGPEAATLHTPDAASQHGTAPKSVVTGVDFASLRGKLPFPITGSYTIVRRFGRQKHPSLPHVETDNAGIDMQTAKGAAVRAVCDGEVSAVFRPDGYNTVIVIRHGQYMTVYANLGSTSVSTGQKVRAGQNIGSVFSDPKDGGRSILHFEIRNGRQKENPETWLRR